MSHLETNLSGASNRIGRIGFIVSLSGFIGVWLVSVASAQSPGRLGEVLYLIGVAMTFLSLPGILFSTFGLRRSPRRLAAWGLAVGIIAAMYLTTICLPLCWRYAPGR